MKNTPAAHYLRLFTRALAKDCAGATAIEYALVALFISLSIVAALPSFAPPINHTFTTISAKL